MDVSSNELNQSDTTTDYPTRLGSVQELLLAKAVIIILSGRTLDWKIFGQATARMLEGQRLFEEDRALKLYSFWYDKKKLVTHAKSKSLDSDTYLQGAFWELIHMHRDARCTDQRDRIYSLLGLLEKNHGFKVDYGEPVIDLFWRAGEHFNAWESSELVDTLRVALLQSHDHDNRQDEDSKADNNNKVNPLTLIDSLRLKPDLQVRIPIRRAWPTTSLISRVTRRFKCKFDECHNAPRIRCTRADIALCANARAYGRTEHGCIHALAQPVDRPAAERFEIKLIAHHGATVATTTLPPTALQVLDIGTDSWVGVSTWSSLRKALWERKDLDRTDRVKLQIPAKYAVWIWFGVHPDHLDQALADDQNNLPSAHHALPPGTKVTRSSIEVPPTDGGYGGEPSKIKEGIFE